MTIDLSVEWPERLFRLIIAFLKIGVERGGSPPQIKIQVDVLIWFHYHWIAAIRATGVHVAKIIFK